MAIEKIYTPTEIDKINLERKAKKGIEYKDTRGYTFVWVEEDKLRLKETGSNIIYVPSEENEATNIQGAIDNINNKIVNSRKKIIVDFGDRLYQEDRMFTILDSRVTLNSNIIASKAIRDVGGRSKDEVFAETLEVSAEAGIGVLYLYVKSLCGSISGQFYINYYI